MTSAQRYAATLVGRSLTVSAAAGAGKTSVLAERCAWLVCDAPAPCSVDELLVLTFTDAAAAEMRSRIREVLRRRTQERPHDYRLRQQLLLLDAAQISTIHAFCGRLLRQHFIRLNIDPNASILDADEAGLMLDEALQRVFAARDRSGGDRTSAFRRLVLHHAGGSEETIATQIVQIHRFVRTLQEGSGWLQAAGARLTLTEEQIADLERVALRDEIRRLIPAVEESGEYVHRCLPDWKQYAGEIDQYAAFLRMVEQSIDRASTGLADILQQINACEFRRIAPRLPKDAPPLQAARREEARRQWELVREWHERRIVKRFTLFSVKEWKEGLERIAPYVSTLIELVREVDRDYAQAKRLRHVLDFNDLEQMAYQLLADESGRPTDVAAAMHQQFAHVLVDEYQDINPLQAAILRLASRESSPELSNNLFCVGDVKQSIYSFRMADPQILLDRLTLTPAASADHESVSLSSNFRSGPHIIAGVNRFFERLMTPALGGLDYRDGHALEHGRDEDDPPCPIELHIIERAATTSRASEGPAPDAPDKEPPQEDLFEDWLDIERQAYFIGQRIRLLVQREGVAYRDIAVLLRAATLRAEQMAGILQDLGIPTLANATTGFFAATEVSDMLALLEVLDNMQQDIPLAAVMRSGVTGTRFNETELLTIKRFRPALPFNACVREYAGEDAREPLQQKVRELLAFLSRYRTHVRRSPLAEVLALIFAETGCLASVAGRSGGPQRVANLLMLQNRARQFSHFGGQQTLYAFLRFIEKLRRQGQDLGPGNATSEATDAVRVMTIHNSKGLEFPVVFVANLEKRFNLEDARRTICFDRDEYLAMPVVDPERRIRYPSWTTHRVRERLIRRTLGEELRILYVALTRAKDRLILVGSQSLEDVQQAQSRWQSHEGPIGELHLLAANCCLDWLIPAIASLPDREAAWHGPENNAPQHSGQLLHVHMHAGLSGPPAERESDQSNASRRAACAALEPLPPREPLWPDDPRIEAVFDRIDTVYPHAPLSTVPAVLNVSDFKRRINLRTEEDDLRSQLARRLAHLPRPEFLDRTTDLTSAAIGSATHVFLQHLDYGRTDQLRPQLDALVQRGTLSAAEAEQIDLDSVSWFLGTDQGRRAITQSDRLEREVPFISKVPTGEFDPAARSEDPQDFIIVRGMVDLLIPTADGFEVVDFKTDRITADQVPDRAAGYTDQIRHYARAISGIWRCRVGHAALVFLTPRCLQSLKGPPASWA